MVMWFGLGIAPKIILAGTFVFFIVFMNAAAGIQSVNRHHVNIIRVIGASRGAILFKIVVPQWFLSCCSACVFRYLKR